MGNFIRRWHPLLILLIGLYLAIPKPAPDPAEVDDAFLERYDENADGEIDEEEYLADTEGEERKTRLTEFKTRDSNNDGILTEGSMFRWPLYAYRMSLGQDLKGGSSLRYRLVQQDLRDARDSLIRLVEGLQGRTGMMSAEARAKFGELIAKGELEVDGFALREASDETDDFDLLLTPGLFDEERVDAARRYYQIWNEASHRRKDKDLVGPTIVVLNRRLNSTGITELNIAKLGEERLEVKLPKFASTKERDRYKALLETTGKLQFRVLAPDKRGYNDLTPPELPREDGFKYKWLEVVEGEVIPRSKNLDGKQVVLTQMIDAWNVTGKDIDSIGPSSSQSGLAVSFNLKGQAVARFEAMTELHQQTGEDPRNLAIIIDDFIYSAPTINEKISGSVQISGRYTRVERDGLINVLKSGSLNVKLVLEGEESVGPSEGAEAVRRGFFSLILGAILVFFMALVLYRGMGLLTIFNLVTVVALLGGAMAAGLGTLTMPGIAGVVLTIGMAVDANILINERIREELERGLNTRGAMEEGFKNAFSSIVDANVTTLLTAIILYKVGSGPIQGFALTLAIGIAATLYSSLAAYKAMMTGILNVKRDLKFNMAKLSFVRGRKIDFLSWIKYGMVVSAIFVIGGGSFIISRGAGVLGIEFRGGHTFRIQLAEGQSREKIAEHLIDPQTGLHYDWAENVELQPVYGMDEATETDATRYDFRFPMQDAWVNRDQNDVNTKLRNNLQAALSDIIAATGWDSRITGKEEVTLRVQMKFRLADPEAFKKNHAEDFEEGAFWKKHERGWRRSIETPKTKANEWFGAVVRNPDVFYEILSPDEGGKRQNYILGIQKIPVTDEADLRKKLEAFKKALQKNFVDDPEVVLLDGDMPEPAVIPTRGRIRVKLSLTEPVDVEEFKAGIESSPALTAAGMIATEVTALEVTEGQGTEFVIKTGVLDFVEKITDPGSALSLEAKLREVTDDWIEQDNEANDRSNYISEPFLLASAIGATVATESQWRALLAILAALVVVVIYIRLRFASVAWGLAAVTALIHDTVVVVGLIGVADYFGADIKIDLTVVAALLTVIGYSLNDTIITFDRIRELLKKDRLATGGKTPLRDTINAAINQMLSRTLLTSGSTLATTLAMLIFGGPLLRGFAFAMTCGVLVGTFSSIYVAGPVLLFFDRRGEGGLLDMTEEEEEEVEKEAGKIAAKSEKQEKKKEKDEKKDDKKDQPKGDEKD